MRSSAKERTQCSLQWSYLWWLLSVMELEGEWFLRQSQVWFALPKGVCNRNPETLEFAVPKWKKNNQQNKTDALNHVIYLCLNWFLLICVITEKVVIFHLRLLSASVDHLYVGLIRTALISFASVSLSVTEAIFRVVNGKIFHMF